MAPPSEDGPTTETRRMPPRDDAPSWIVDPGLIVASVAGIFLLVSGIVAIARADFVSAGLYAPDVIVGGFHHTPLLGFIEIVLGLLVLGAGTLGRDGPAITFLGVVALVVGLVWLIEPGAFAPYLGVTRANGWQHVVLGALLAVAGQLTPFTIRPPQV